jgi:hypothetical protein
VFHTTIVIVYLAALALEVIFPVQSTHINFLLYHQISILDFKLMGKEYTAFLLRFSFAGVVCLYVFGLRGLCARGIGW